MTTVWGVTSFDSGAGGYAVHCLFTTEAEAQKYASQDSEYEVEEFTLYDQAPEPYTYWERIAEVYPDRHVEESTRETQAHPPYVMPPLDDDIGPHDGHMQGHCGEHVYVSGTDRVLVEQSFQRQVAEAIARQDGICHNTFGKHEGAVDGINIYQADWRTVRRRGMTETEKLACGNYFEHDWGEWSAWREVAPGQFNRQQICKRCVSCSISFSNMPIMAGL